jgi:hypothetical protein
MTKTDLEMKAAWRMVKFLWVLPLLGFLLINILKVDFGDYGPYGDFVAGTFVPVLTFASFLMVVATLGMQKEQLELQRRELRSSIDEMKATRKEFEVQNKTLSIQRFENTFFSMVSLHNQIIESIHYGGQYQKDGRKAITPIFSYFKQTYQNSLMNKLFEGEEEINRIKIAYKEFFKHTESQLGHYFRNLYRIVKFIDHSHTLEFEEKKTYVGIIKAQLSSYELVLLLYNGLSEHGIEFLPLMRKYNLLDNLNHELLILKSHYKIYEEYKKN